MIASVALLAAIAAPLAAAGHIKPVNVAWHQSRDSPVHELFRRGDVDLTAANFTANYPPLYYSPNGTNIPQAWLDKLKTITLPANCPVATANTNSNPTYEGSDPNGGGADICSFSNGCHTADDLFDGPDNTFVLTFDDGPSDASPTLYDFLHKNNINGNATHFFIGTNVVGAPLTAQSAFTNGGHIAVHTWSHPYMTTKTNEEVLGELGWTMQSIADVTGGHLPAFWRPPYGDVDNRVRAIASQVFGLKCVLWNHDTNDWKIGEGNVTQQSVEQVMDTWFTGARTPGILALEHELNNNTVDVFINEYPGFAKNNWIIKSVADAFGMNWYQNAAANGAITSTMSVGQVNTAVFTNQTAPSSTAAASATGTNVAAAGSTTGAATSAKAQTNKDSGAGNVAVPVAAIVGAAALAIAL